MRVNPRIYILIIHKQAWSLFIADTHSYTKVVLSEPGNYADNYEKLLRWIYD